MGKTSGRESNEAAFFVSAEELDWGLQNLGGRQKKGFGVFGSAKSAGSHGNGFIWSKGPDFLWSWVRTVKARRQVAGRRRPVKATPSPRRTG